MFENGQTNALTQGFQRAFRGIRAALAYQESEFDEYSISKMKNDFARINVKFFAAGELQDLQSEFFDVIGFLWSKPFDEVRNLRNQSASDGLLIGFSSNFDRSLRQLDAGVICRGSALNSVFHFFESLTVPSLLNIDLADLKAIARGIGVSFYEESDSARELIKRLPKESFVAKSGLLHFACRREVTLDEIYSVSKAISLRQPCEKISAEEAEFRRFNIKMGVRIIDEGGKSEPESSKNRRLYRISLTAILFGI
ncbi:MAG: hypothetical protein ACREBS_01985 [Nitrososphaerales archaeon]